MEIKGLTRAQLRGKLAEHCISKKQFAAAAQMRATEVSDILRGAPVGPQRKARIERAIVLLKLTEPAPDDGADRLIFRVTQL